MEENGGISYRRRARVRRRLLGAFALCAASLVLGLVYVSVNLRPAMAAQAEAKIRAVCLYAMNDAVLQVLEEGDGYRDLVQVSGNGEHVYLLQANTPRMNLLASNCANAAQERISQLGGQGISIPFGTVTGVPFLSGKGPVIRLSFTPVGSVESAFHSEFVSAGINQTLYRVNLNLTASVKLILPGLTETVRVNMQAAICETILVGKVPEVYTDVAEENMLDLIPAEAP